VFLVEFYLEATLELTAEDLLELKAYIEFYEFMRTALIFLLLPFKFISCLRSILLLD
jgi:hypothetical protein